MAIEVQSITKRYENQEALNNVSFTIKKGEIVGFLGPNGAGKSTMMKILTGIIPPTSGDAYVNGVNVLEDSMTVRKITGYLPENNPLYEEMYIREYLEFLRGIHRIKDSKKRIDQIIEQTGLTGERHKKIGQLSKGYRQRVGIAQALLHDPEVLILDEPTSGLDPNQIIEIRNLISSVGKNKTVMLSTHIMQEVEAICDRIIIINKGQIVADDATQSIKKHFSIKENTFHVEFDKEIDLDKIKKYIASANYQVVKPSIIHIEVEKGDDLYRQLVDFCQENQYKIITFQKFEKSLEQVFQELTKQK
ncbi:MAG TPA: gliding motility-associated ABC transporter ATP-binding subunit GldA [Salinivirgaceae bacterium]|nr:gliding motility-associated ABC transporter ATP-binding subunit GldA [Salinivirgaceae bacterium]